MFAFPPGPSTLIVLFDGGCPVCRRTVRNLRRLDWRGRLQFADATVSDNRARIAPGLTEAAAMQQMTAVARDGRRFGGYDAMIRIAQEIPLLWPIGFAGGWPGIRQAGVKIYRAVAANRRRSGRCSDELCSPAFRRRQA